MLPDRVSNPGPLTCESGALPIALRGPAQKDTISILTIYKITKWHKTEKNCRKSNSSQSKSGHTLFVPSFVK